MNHECKENYHLYDWMFTLDESTALLPHFEVGDEKVRVNYCITCGKEIREVTIELNELVKLKTERR